MSKTTSKNISFNKIMFISIVVLCSIAVLGLFAGTWCDFQFSKAISQATSSGQNHKTFAWYFAMIPGITTTILFTFVIVSVITFNPFYHKWTIGWKVFYFISAYAMGMLLVLYQSFDGFISQIYESSSIKMPDNRLASPMLAYALIVAIMLMSGFSCFNLFYLRKKIFIKSIDIVQVFKWAVFAFVGMIFATVIVSVLKQNVHRERFFQLMITGHEENFKPWYSLLWNANSQDEKFTTSVMTSFPSGHTTWAMATCTLIPFLELIPMKQKKQKIIMQVTIIGFSGFFILIVMICRITSGNHYLSDVTAAVLINMACFISSYFICNWLSTKNNA